MYKLLQRFAEGAGIVFIIQFLFMWFIEGVRWSNYFGEIAKNSLCNRPPTDDNLNSIMTMLSTHHQSLANLLAVAGVIATTFTVIFYLERVNDKEELEKRLGRVKELESQVRCVSTNAEVMNECQQLIDSILLQFWTINEPQTKLPREQEVAENMKIVHNHLHYSAEIKCILSKDNKQQMQNGLGRLRDLVESVEKKEGKQALLFDVEQLLHNLHKIGRLPKDKEIDCVEIANGILKSMGKPPLE